MKLAELKEEVRSTWESLESWKGQVLQPENFLPEMQKYGDLRRKATWEKALIQLYPALFHRSCLDASFLITNVFNFTPGKAFYEYRHELFEAFLMYPDSLELIKMGLEEIYSYTPEQQERANADGFYRLVQEQCERATRLPAGLTGQLQALTAQAAS